MLYDVNKKSWTEEENTSGREAQRSLDLMPLPCWAMLCWGMLGLFIDKQASQLQQWAAMNSIQDMRNVQKMTMVSGFCLALISSLWTKLDVFCFVQGILKVSPAIATMAATRSLTRQRNVDGKWNEENKSESNESLREIRSEIRSEIKLSSCWNAMCYAVCYALCCSQCQTPKLATSVLSCAKDCWIAGARNKLYKHIQLQDATKMFLQVSTGHKQRCFHGLPLAAASWTHFILASSVSFCIAWTVSRRHCSMRVT